jgi:four helix bundle protein
MARNHRELECWQLANDLRKRVLKLLKHPDVARDLDFCDQAARAVNSACHNTSEGFYKYNHKPFAASLRIARGELGETNDQFDAALQKGYITPAEFDELVALCSRALAANAGLINYLDGNSKK